MATRTGYFPSDRQPRVEAQAIPTAQLVHRAANFIIRGRGRIRDGTTRTSCPTDSQPSTLDTDSPAQTHLPSSSSRPKAEVPSVGSPGAPNAALSHEHSNGLSPGASTATCPSTDSLSSDSRLWRRRSLGRLNRIPAVKHSIPPSINLDAEPSLRRPSSPPAPACCSLRTDP